MRKRNEAFTVLKSIERSQKGEENYNADAWGMSSYHFEAENIVFICLLLGRDPLEEME